MKFLPLIWKNVWRRKIRTTFTLLSIFVAFLLFGILMTIRTAFSFGVDIAGLDRLVLIHKVSLDHAAAGVVPGAAAADAGRRARDAPDVVRRHLPGPGELLRQHRGRAGAVPEDLSGVHGAARAGKAWLADRQGAIVGRDLAERFGWKVGDRDSADGDDLAAEAGRQTWEFNLVGHLRRRRRHRQDAVLLPVRLPRREPRAGARGWSAGTS